MISKDNIKVGMFVKTNREFVDVPIGTIGIIDEIYDGGCFVTWYLERHHPKIPDTYRDLVIRIALTSNNTKGLGGSKEFWDWLRENDLARNRPLRDGFSYADLLFLDSLQQEIKTETEL